MIELNAYPGYALTDDFKVWSHISRRVLKGTKIRTGYVQFRLCGIDTALHIIVAEQFLGKKPDGMEVNHIDANKDNNRPENLEYVTHAQNMHHLWHSEHVPEEHRQHVRNRLKSQWTPERRALQSKITIEMNKRTWKDPTVNEKRRKAISLAKRKEPA